MSQTAGNQATAPQVKDLATRIETEQGPQTQQMTELAQGSNPATRNFAQQIISAQQAEMSEMQALLQVI